MNESTSQSDESTETAYVGNMLTTAKGSSIVTFGSLLEYAASFVTALLVARSLGAEEYGLYGLALSTAIITATLGVFGLDTALVRYVAIANSRRDEPGVWSVLQIGVGGAILFGCLTGAGLFVFSAQIAEQLFDEPKLTPLLRLFGLIVPFMTLSSVLVGASRGFKRQQFPVVAQNVAQSVVRLCLIIILSLAGLNAFLASLATGLAIIVSTCILLWLINREFSLRRTPRVSPREIREILSYSVPVLLSGLLKRFRGNIQAILLGAFSTMTSVGVFLIANKINTFGRIFSLAVMKSAQPIIAELDDKNDGAQMGRVYQTTSRWIFTLNFPFVLTMMLLPGPILSIFGESFTSGATVLMILAWANLINVSTGMSGVVIDMTGHTKLKLANSILQVVLFVIMNLLLIPRWDIVGAAFASLISLSILHFLRQLQVWILFRHWPYNRSFIKPVAAGMATVVFALLMQQVLDPDINLFVAAINAVGIFVFYAGAVLLLGLEPEDRIAVIGVVQRVGVSAVQLRVRLAGLRPAGRPGLSASDKRSTP